MCGLVCMHEYGYGTMCVCVISVCGRVPWRKETVPEYRYITA